MSGIQRGSNVLRSPPFPRESGPVVTPVDFNQAMAQIERALQQLQPLPLAGPTTARPALPLLGQTFFDTTLGIPIWWDGTQWDNASGTPV